MTSPEREISSSPAAFTVLRSWPVAVQLVACTAAVVVASAGYGAFFAGNSFLLPIAGAATLGTLCGLAIGHWRRPAGLAITGSILIFLLYLVYAVFPGATDGGLPGFTAVRTVLDGLLHGLARMLSIAAPADVQDVLLVLPVTIGFLAALSCALLIRGRSMLLPMLPPLLTFVSCLLLSADNREFEWAITLGFLALGLLVLLLRANHEEPDTNPADAAFRVTSGPSHAAAGASAGVGRVALGLPIVGIVAILAIVGSTALPVANAASRFDLREVRQPIIDIDDRLNPLVDVRRQLQQDSPTPVFTARIVADPASPVDHLRVAALDSFDGAQWTSSARYVRTGSTLPAGPVVIDPQPIELDIELHSQMPPPYLPQAGRPVSTDAADIAFDAGSATMVTGTRPLDGYRYHLTAQISPPDADVSTALPDQGPDFAALTQLPAGVGGNTEIGLSALAEQLATGKPAPYAQLTAIADHLRAFHYAADAPPGQSYAALARLLPTASGQVDQRITEEQTVSAFVIMARDLGFPARVAVGYTLPAAQADGSYQVMMADADAWAEVAFAGIGWVAFDPTAPRQGEPPRPPATSDTADNDAPPALVRPDIVGPDVIVDTGLLGSGLPTWLFVLLVPVLLLLIGAGGVVLAKQLQRRRRMAGSAADRITGAWSEARRRLRENGLHPRASQTPDEIGALTTQRFGSAAGGAVCTLAPLVSAAWYAPEPPEVDSVVAAWDLEAELTSILDARRPWPRRWLSRLDPRPLVRPRRTPARGDVSTGPALIGGVRRWIRSIARRGSR